MRVDPDTIAMELSALRRAFEAAVGSHDAGATAAAYAEDARLFLPTGQAIEGRDAIEVFWRTGFEAGASRIDLRPSMVDIGDGVAWEAGEYGLTSEPPYERPAVERGRYLTVHRQGSDGRWQRALDLLSPDGPGEPEEPEEPAAPGGEHATEMQQDTTTMRRAST